MYNLKFNLNISFPVTNNMIYDKKKPLLSQVEIQ